MGSSLTHHGTQGITLMERDDGQHIGVPTKEPSTWGELVGLIESTREQFNTEVLIGGKFLFGCAIKQGSYVHHTGIARQLLLTKDGADQNTPLIISDDGMFIQDQGRLYSLVLT